MRSAAYAIVAAAMALAGCRDKDRPAGPPRPRHPDPAAAIAQCRAAVQDAASLSPAQVQQTVATACAGLFVEEACRTAWENLPLVAPPARIATLTDACAKAYCPLLPAPKPAMCGDAPPAGDRVAAWAALYRSIRLLDLGDAAEIMPGVEVKLDLPEAPAPPPPGGAAVTWPTPHVALTAQKVTLRWVAPDGTPIAADTIEQAAPFDCAALHASLRDHVDKAWPDPAKRPAAAGAIRVEATKDVAYASVHTVLACINAAKGPDDRPLYPDVQLSTP